jgi:hypothetical protein
MRFQKSQPAGAATYVTTSAWFRILNLHQKNLAGDQQDFVVCRWHLAEGNTRHGLVGLRRGSARHGPKHFATRPFPAGPHTDVLCCNRRQHNNCKTCVTAVQTCVSAASKTLPTAPTRRR